MRIKVDLFMKDPTGVKKKMRPNQIGRHLLKGWTMEGLSSNGGIEHPEVERWRQAFIRKRENKKAKIAQAAEEARMAGVNKAKAEVDKMTEVEAAAKVRRESAEKVLAEAETNAEASKKLYKDAVAKSEASKKESKDGKADDAGTAVGSAPAETDKSSGDVTDENVQS